MPDVVPQKWQASCCSASDIHLGFRVIICPKPCLQAAVYLARTDRGGGARRSRARSCHAPARRIARTTISLGHEEGVAFGLRAIRCARPASTRSTVSSSPADVLGGAFASLTCCAVERARTPYFCSFLHF